MGSDAFSDILSLGASNVAKLAIFIFIIAGNYVNDTFSCSLRRLINDSMIIRHFLGFFIVLIFVGFSEKTQSIFNKIQLSLFLYVWYVFIMRSPIYITIAVIFIIIFLYIMQEYIQDLETLLKDSSTDKKVDNKNIQMRLQYFMLVRNILFSISVILSTIGFGYYFLQNKQLYKSKFNIKKFIIGISDQECLK
tara:strand:+ start:6500 stop:7078 length:579 start_codon:yes stop_codon:yes gene_type:complete